MEQDKIVGHWFLLKQEKPMRTVLKGDPVGIDEGEIRAVHELLAGDRKPFQEVRKCRKKKSRLGASSGSGSQVESSQKMGGQTGGSKMRRWEKLADESAMTVEEEPEVERGDS